MILLPLLLMAAAVPDEREPDCGNPITQLEMNRCAWLEFEEADKALNGQWAKTSAVMKERDADYGDLYQDGRPGYFAVLLEGQRAWLKYRQGHCAAEGYEARGGSMEPMLVSGCMARLTKLRTQELRELVEYPE